MKAAALSAALAIVLSSFSAAQTSLPANPTVPESVGINIHFTDPKSGEMEMLAASGVKWVRVDMLWNQSWSWTEKEKGVYDFSRHDHLFDLLKQNGIRPIVIFAYANPLYDKGLSPYTDEGRNAYAAWAVAAAKHYAGRGILWEVWNEPNGRLLWKPTPKADDYAKLAVTVGKAFKEQVPQEMLVGPALAKFDWPFIETCFKAGVLEYWSAVTVHPYRDADPETVAQDCRKLRRMIARYAPPGKDIPIISGEWGYFMHLDDKTTPELQGKLLARQWLTNLSNDIAVSVWYDWKDDGTNPKDIEHHFGTVGYEYHADHNPVYDPKPGYTAAKTMTTILGGFHFNKPLVLDSATDHVLLFSKDDEVRLAAWTQGTPHDLVVPASPGRFSVSSHLGEQLPSLVADEKGLTIHLTDAPQYLIPDSPNDLLRIAAAWESLPPEVKVTAPADAKVETTLRNPTGQPIHVKITGAQAVDLAPGHSAKLVINVPVLRSQVHDVFRMEVELPGAKLAQKTGIAVTNPLDVVLLPLGERKVMARIENPSLQPFSGTVTLTASAGSRNVSATTAVELPAGQREQMVQVDTTEPLPMDPSLEVTMKSTDGATVARSTMSYSTDPAIGLGENAYGIWPTKDQSFAPANAPEAPPTRTGSIMRLDYRFTAAATRPTTAPAAAPQQQPVVTLSITPRPKQDRITAIEGKPKSLVMWIYGDGSGNPICARYTDATGQVFQPQSAITWKGWQCVSFPLDDTEVWHYGGAKDGVIHYPIQWNTLFLLDSAGKKSREGTIYLCSPTVVWDTPRQEK